MKELDLPETSGASIDCEYEVRNIKIKMILDKLKRAEVEIFRSQSANDTGRIRTFDLMRFRSYFEDLLETVELFNRAERSRNPELENKYLRKRVVELEKKYLTRREK